MMLSEILQSAPDAVRAYFALTAAGDHGAASVVFAPDAHVTDDGQDYHGRAAIRAWLTRVPGEFTYTVTPLDVRSDALGHTVVTNRVEGTFPGGRVDLASSFDLDGEQRITRLTISAVAA